MSRPPRTIALMLESDGPGGAEIFLLHAAQELRERGYRVVPVLPDWKTGWLGEQFRNRGFDPMTFSMTYALDGDCLNRLVRDLDRARVDVVHSHEFTMAVYGTVATRILRRRHVITMHGDQRTTQALRRRLALRWACHSSEAAVAVSEQTRRHLIESSGIRPGTVRTILNGIPDPRGDGTGPVREFGLRQDEVVLLAAGTLYERKGHIVLLRALQRLNEQKCVVPWRLIIAGEGPERPRLEAFLAESGLGGRVHLPGHRSDVPHLQAAAQVLVMPSLWEGLPLAVLEGMYAGNAVVASRASGIPEAVRDQVDGLLVAPGDVDALAAALRALIEDPALRARMGESARERARSHFSIARMMDDYETLYLGDEILHP